MRVVAYILLIFSFLGQAFAGINSACSLDSTYLTTGFHLKYYYYTFLNRAYTNSEYLMSGYRTESLLGNEYSVTVLSASFPKLASSVTSTYGTISFTPSHFTFEYTGYFKRMFFLKILFYFILFLSI